MTEKCGKSTEFFWFVGEKNWTLIHGGIFVRQLLVVFKGEFHLWDFFLQMLPPEKWWHSKFSPEGKKGRHFSAFQNHRVSGTNDGTWQRGDLFTRGCAETSRSDQAGTIARWWNLEHPISHRIQAIYSDLSSPQMVVRRKGILPKMALEIQGKDLL